MLSFSIWLNPSEPYKTILTGVIENLSRTFDSPVFAPHVTVFSDVEASAPQVASTIERYAAIARPIMLDVIGLAGTEERFRSFFIELKESTQLLKLRDKLVRELNLPKNKAPRPHISLVYPRSQLDKQDREGLHASIPLTSSFKFDSLSIVTPTNRSLGWEDVASWRTTNTISLAG